jgi:hypothetical protein
MAIQEVEFDFPDSDARPTDRKGDISIEVEGAVGRTEINAKPKLEIEIVDDTPEADRGREVSDPPDDITEDELKNYSKSAKKRLERFSKGYHDERRAKEQAVRERVELERYVKSVMDENTQLKGSVNKNQHVLVEQAKRAVEAEVFEAKRQYKEAYEAGNSDSLVEAQEALTNAKIRMERVNNIKIPSLQEQETAVQLPPTTQGQPQPVQQDVRAQAWAKQNAWFGDEEHPDMTAYALGLDAKLRRNGVAPTSDTYYEQINNRMRQVFPDYFDSGDEAINEVPQRKKASSVVAPATRSMAPKKVKLSPSSQALARRLGLTLEQYAAQVAELEMKQNG